MKIHIVLPVNLFKDQSIFHSIDMVYVYEEPTNFTYLKFHKLKLVYHRATMKAFYDKIKINKKYINFN